MSDAPKKKQYDNLILALSKYGLSPAMYELYDKRTETDKDMQKLITAINESKLDASVTPARCRFLRNLILHKTPTQQDANMFLSASNNIFSASKWQEALSEDRKADTELNHRGYLFLATFCKDCYDNIIQTEEFIDAFYNSNQKLMKVLLDWILRCVKAGVSKEIFVNTPPLSRSIITEEQILNLFGAPDASQPISMNSVPTSRVGELADFGVDDVDDIFQACEYKGFNSQEVRQWCIGQGFTAGCVFAAIAAYINVGTNYRKLASSSKTKDPIKAARVQNMLNAKGVLINKGLNGYTLANIATAFLPVLSYLRNANRDRLQNQFAGTISAVYQDPCMGAMAVIDNQESEYRLYQKAFYKALKSTRKGKLPQSVDWLHLSVNGLNRDLKVQHFLIADKKEKRDVVAWVDRILAESQEDGDIGRTFCKTSLTDDEIEKEQIQTAKA